MSVITKIILSTCFDSEHCVETLNKFLEAEYFPQDQLQEIGQHAGGGKEFDNLYAAAINYFRVDEFLVEMRKQPWDYTADVQLLVKGEDDELFRSFTAEGKDTYLTGYETHDASGDSDAR